MTQWTEETAGVRLSPCSSHYAGVSHLQLIQTAEIMMRKIDSVAAEPQHGQRMLFTGPDGIGDYRPRSNYSPWYIGVGASSPEATGDLGYLWRAAPHGPPLMSRQLYVGEVGWGMQYNQLLNSGTLLSNMQIKKTELRTTLEDRVTQKFQNKQRVYQKYEESILKYIKAVWWSFDLHNNLRYFIGQCTLIHVTAGIILEEAARQAI